MTTMSELRTTDRVYLGPVIRELRQEAGITQAAVSREMHVDPSMIALWEHDDRPVPRTRLPSLAAALEVRTEILFERARVEPEKSPRPAVEVTQELATYLELRVARLRAASEALDRAEAIEPPVLAIPEDVNPYRQKGLRWCAGRHGAAIVGPVAWHHHGPLGVPLPGALVMSDV